MNRFEYALAQLQANESFVAKDSNVKLYDGDEKTGFEDGDVVLTTHRLFWAPPGDIGKGLNALSLPLKYILSLDEEWTSSGFFGRKKRIILHLSTAVANKSPGPLDYSTASFIKLSGKNGVDESFVQALRETVSARVWEATGSPSSEEAPKIKLRTGIAGIERDLQARQKQTDESISLAFKDLNKLMTMAKDMVGISKVISSKIRDRQGDISEDETVRFKSYLMSLGIDDPVTRGSVQSENEYYQRLAKEICETLLDPITEAGGMMSMADVYCRINRARGLQLLSPDDLLNACKLLDGPVKMKTFPSGAIVLQLETHDDEKVAEETEKLVETKESVSVEELAREVNISLLLAMERLLTAERAGRVCRDESIEGLRFYPNLLLRNA